MKRSVRRLLVPALLVGLTLPWAAWADSNKKPADRSPATDAKVQEASPQAYLGIGIEALHPSFATHLPDMLISGQGVLVRAVMPGSPAAKAGVKGDDILITYDDQKLFSPEQLAKLVMNHKPHRDVNLGIVRQGQVKHLRVTLGAHERQVATAPTTPRRRFVPWWGGDLALPQWHDMWSQEHTNPTAQTPAPGERFESRPRRKSTTSTSSWNSNSRTRTVRCRLANWPGRETRSARDQGGQSIPKDERQCVLRTLGSPGHPLALSPWEESEEGGPANTTSAYDAFSWFGWPLVPMDF